MGGESEWQQLIEAEQQAAPQAEQKVKVQVVSTEQVVRKDASVKRYRGSSRSTAIEALQLPEQLAVHKLADAVRTHRLCYRKKEYQCSCGI